MRGGVCIDFMSSDSLCCCGETWTQKALPPETHTPARPPTRPLTRRCPTRPPDRHPAAVSQPHPIPPHPHPTQPQHHAMSRHPTPRHAMPHQPHPVPPQSHTPNPTLSLLLDRCIPNFVAGKGRIKNKICPNCLVMGMYVSADRLHMLSDGDGHGEATADPDLGSGPTPALKNGHSEVRRGAVW